MNLSEEQLKHTVARVLQRIAVDDSAELAQLREQIQAMQTRLDKLELEGSAAATQTAKKTLANDALPVYAYSPWSAGAHVIIENHPSAERLDVAEDSINELAEFFESSKQCNLDPSGKPCDHCAMCSARGF